MLGSETKPIWQCPAEGFITEMSICGHKITLDPPVAIQAGDKIFMTKTGILVNPRPVAFEKWCHEYQIADSVLGVCCTAWLAGGRHRYNEALDKAAALFDDADTWVQRPSAIREKILALKETDHA